MNITGLIIKSVVIPERVKVPKLPSLPIFHEKKQPPTDEGSIIQILDLLNRFVLQLQKQTPIPLNQLKEKVFSPEYIAYIKLKISLNASLENIQASVIEMILSEIEEQNLTKRQQEIRQEMANTLSEFLSV